MEKSVILSGKNLCYSYTSKTDVLCNLNFEICAGDVFVILGPNGAGKSTLLNCISNVLQPKQGGIFLKNKAISAYSLREISKIMGYVPQISTPVFSLNVRDYVVMGRTPYMNILSVPGEKEYKKADEAMAKMNIEYLADKMYENISGGEKQLTQIARVLTQEPEIILMDEPTNHLDYGNQLKIIEIVHMLAKEGMTVILTSHIPDHAILLNGLVGLMDQAGKLTVGNSCDILSEETLSKLYGTEIHLVDVEVLNRTVCVAGKAF